MVLNKSGPSLTSPHDLQGAIKPIDSKISIQTWRPNPFVYVLSGEPWVPSLPRNLPPRASLCVFGCRSPSSVPYMACGSFFVRHQSGYRELVAWIGGLGI